MPPTPRWTKLSFTSSRSSLRRLSVTASREPWTSALSTRLSVAVSPRWICSKRSSSLAPVAAEATGRCPDRRNRWARASPRVRAVAWSLATRSSSPACGGSENPSTCTGIEGSASLTWSPWSSIRALTLPQAAPATTGSPTRRVPLSTMTVATGPRPASRLASSTVPRARPSGLARSSSTSATRAICSSRSSMPVLWQGRDLRPRWCRRPRPRGPAPARTAAAAPGRGRRRRGPSC